MRVLFLAIAAVLASALSAGAEVPDSPVTRGPTDERVAMGSRQPDDGEGPKPSGIPVITIRDGELCGSGVQKRAQPHRLVQNALSVAGTLREDKYQWFGLG